MLPSTPARITSRGTLKNMKFLIVKPSPFRVEFKALRFKSVSERQEKLMLISVQHIQEDKTDQCLIQGEGNGKPLL